MIVCVQSALQLRMARKVEILRLAPLAQDDGAGGGVAHSGRRASGKREVKEAEEVEEMRRAAVVLQHPERAATAGRLRQGASG